jgi:hypothetical protein
MMSDCIRPGEISDDDLIGYAAGEQTRRVRDHVRACPRCAAVAAQHAADENRLGRALFRFDCPTAMELGEYQLGMLPVSTVRRISAHLASCPHCTAELATASAFLDAPEPTSSRAVDALGAVAGTLRHVVAQLLSSPQPAAALRGGGRPVTLVYGADDLTLTLHPQAADRPRGQVQLLGFVEQRGANLDSLAGSRVRLLAGPTTAATAIIDEIGNFMVGPVPQATYDLEVTTSTMQVVIPDLQLVMKR